MNTAHQEKLQQAREPSSIPLRRKEGSVRAPHGYLRLGRRLPDANPNGALQHYGHAGIRRKNGIAMPNNCAGSDSRTYHGPDHAFQTAVTDITPVLTAALLDQWTGQPQLRRPVHEAPSRI